MQTGDSVDKFAEAWWDANTQSDAWTELNMYFDEPKPYRDSADGISHGRGRTGTGAGEGWVDTKWNKAHYASEPDTDRSSNGNKKVTTVNNSKSVPRNVWTATETYNNANGNEYSNDKLYWTQTQRWDESYEKGILEKAQGTGWLQYRRDRYEDWERMHKNVLWFDTAACLNYGHIGDVNRVTIKPTTTRYRRVQ